MTEDGVTISPMGDFLVIIGTIGLTASLLGMIWLLRAHMTVVQGLLLALSIVVFVYLGVAMFRAEWF